MNIRRTGYDPQVTEQLLKLFETNEIHSDPLLLALTDPDSVRRKYSLPDIKKSYLSHVLRFHPDRNVEKPIELQRQYSLYFGKLSETYFTLIELRLPASLQMVDSTIPYSIKHNYRFITERIEHPVTFDERGVMLKTSHPDTYARVLALIKDFSAFPHESLLRKAGLVRNREEVENFLLIESQSKLNEDLELYEPVLNYGYEYSHYTPEEGWKIPYIVSLKHLERRKVFEAPASEWTVVDREFVTRVGYFKNKPSDHENSSNSDGIILSSGIAKSEGNIVLHKKKHDDGLQLMVNIEPATMAMRTDDGWLFVVKSPFHKHLLPREHFLIPTDKYVDSRGTAIISLDSLSIPEKIEDSDFEELLMEGEIHIPWVCLSPESIDIMRKYKVQNLSKMNELSQR